MHTHTHLTLTLTPSLPHPDHSRLDTLVLRMARHALRVRTAIPVGILSRCIEHLLVFRPFFVHLFEILWTFQHNTVHVCLHSNKSAVVMLQSVHASGGNWAVDLDGYSGGLSDLRPRC